MSFLADLVSLVSPTNRWSFMSYLVDHDRMYPIYIAERFHIPRREYAGYCAWVAASLDPCRFGTCVEELHWDARRHVWVLVLRDVSTGTGRRQAARNVVLGVGTRPHLPTVLRPLAGPPVFHSAQYLGNVERLADQRARHVAVVGSGQSGAEVFVDLLRRQRAAGWSLTWLTRTPSFAPLDYSKLVLEQTTPEYMRYFHGLEPARRDELVSAQWQLYKGISTETLDLVHAELYEHMLDGHRPPVRLLAGAELVAAEPAGGGVRLTGRHRDTGREVNVEADAVVAATGYVPEPPSLLAPVGHLVAWDPKGRYDVSVDHRVRTAPEVTGGMYVQNAELHTHGAASPDLGIGAYRSATILNAVAGREVFRLPKRTAFQSFGGL
ncbi:MAG: lysine N(6)-hydroxylase/L-ornithine N(5)-oxygenase family protein [Acidimicrobiales bacterium]